ncbi:MAG TPA: hypothetical protein VFW62_02555, partial [bacterium]|nr:hypothetical protein [bacterium]
MLVRALRSRRGTEEPLIAQATLDSRTQIISQLWTAFFEDSLEQSGAASVAQRALAQDIVYDLRTRVHFAMADNARAEDVAWLSGLSPQGVLEFAQTSQAAHLLVSDRRQDPPTPAELQACLQAAQLFASLGLNNRVREVTRPLSSHAYGLRDTDPAQAAQRASLLLVLAQIYSQTGAMETELNSALQGVVALDRPGELHESAQLARAMMAMQAGNLLDARDFLITIPGHPMAQTFLQGLQDGQRAQRIAQIVGVLRAVSMNYIERGRASGENMDAVERDTLAGWQEVQRLMMSGEASDVDAALQRIGRTRGFPNFTTGTGEFHIGSNVGYFIGVVSRPGMSDTDFHRAIFELCGFLRMDDYFQAASQIYQMMEADPRTRDHAHARLEAIPAEARFHAGLNVARTLLALRAGPAGMLAVSSTSGASPDEMLQNVAMVVVPFAAARAVAVGAEGLFVARATSGSIRLVRGAGLVVQAGNRTVEGLNYLRFGVRTGTEAAVFTASSMAMHSVFTGRSDHWTWGNFGREFGSMLLTFGLCHGIGYGVRSLGRAASGSESFRAIGTQRVMGGLAYGSTIAGLTGLEYLNEALGLHPHEGEIPLALRVMSSALMDAQMRAATRGLDAVSGGRISAFERSTQGAQTYHDLLPALDRLGLPRPDAEGRMTASAAFVMNLLQARVEQGEDPAAIVASLNPSPRTLRAARAGGAWSEWLRSHALGMAFLFTGMSGGSFGRFPRSTAAEERWWENQETRNGMEDQFADLDFADVYWPSEESPALRLGLPRSPVPEDQLAGLATVLASAPEGPQPPVRIELAGLSDPAGLSCLLPLLRRGVSFEVQVAGRSPAIRLQANSENQLRIQGIDAALLRILGPRLRENFAQVAVEGVSSEAEALELVRTSAEVEGPELAVLDGEGRETIRYRSGGFNVPDDGSRSDYPAFLERVVQMAGRRPVRVMIDGLPLLTVSRGPQGAYLNSDLNRANPAQALAALRRLGEVADGPFRGAEIQIQNLDPTVHRRSEVRAALTALTRSALSGGSRRLSLRLSGPRGEAGPLAFRLSPNPEPNRTRFRLESELPVEEIPEVLSEYLAAESAEIFRLGNPAATPPTVEELGALWRAALSHTQAYSQHRQAGEEYRPYWSEAGSVELWQAGISALGSYARARGNAERVQRALRNILQYSDPAESTVLSSGGFEGRTLGDNGFELLRLAERDQGSIGPALEIINGLMGRHGNVEVGGALVGMVYRRRVADEGGARSEVDVLREQVQTATADGGRYRFVLLPEDHNCRVTTPDWIVEGLDENGRPSEMTTVEVKARNVQGPGFNENWLRETLRKGTSQLTTHGFSNGNAEPRAILALRFSGVERNATPQATVARLLAEEYRRLNQSA